MILKYPGATEARSLTFTFKSVNFCIATDILESGNKNKEEEEIPAKQPKLDQKCSESSEIYLSFIRRLHFFFQSFTRSRIPSNLPPIHSIFIPITHPLKLLLNRTFTDRSWGKKGR